MSRAAYLSAICVVAIAAAVMTALSYSGLPAEIRLHLGTMVPADRGPKTSIFFIPIAIVAVSFLTYAKYVRGKASLASGLDTLSLCVALTISILLLVAEKRVIAANEAPRIPARVIVAKPEVQTTVHLGDVLILPLYDSRQLAHIFGDTLRFVRTENIGSHDLWNDMRTAAPFDHPDMPRAIYDAESNRGEVLVATKIGMSTAIIYLTLPCLAEHCVDCRVVHYFIRVEKAGPSPR